MENSLVVLFDLDNTLIDTEKIKQEVFFETARDFGMSLVEAEDLYGEIRQKEGKILISEATYASAVAERHGGTDEQTVMREMDHRLEILGGDVVFPGVFELLTNLEQREIPFYLLSLGIPEWQKKKIRFAGLSKFFSDDSILLTDSENSHEGKAELIRKKFGEKNTGEGMVLFNDKPTETREILGAFERMRACQRRDMRDTRYTEEQFGELKEQLGERLLAVSTEFRTLSETFTIHFLAERYGEIRR